MEVQLVAESSLKLPGQLISSDSSLISGQGTYKTSAGNIHSALLGYVEFHNKLVVVNHYRKSYSPQVGDVVVGRVSQIVGKRWRVELGQGTANLHLNSIYLSEQRKKSDQDELHMRQLFREGDLIVAQIHSIDAHKSINLHTRNKRYGKLPQGLAVKVDRVKRVKHHFVNILQGVETILGTNGLVYIGRGLHEGEEEMDKKSVYGIIFLGAILRVLDQFNIQINPQLLREFWRLAEQQKLGLQDLRPAAKTFMGDQRQQDALLRLQSTA